MDLRTQQTVILCYCKGNLKAFGKFESQICQIWIFTQPFGNKCFPCPHNNFHGLEWSTSMFARKVVAKFNRLWKSVWSKSCTSLILYGWKWIIFRNSFHSVQYGISRFRVTPRPFELSAILSCALSTIAVAASSIVSCETIWVVRLIEQWTFRKPVCSNFWTPCF